MRKAITYLLTLFLSSFSHMKRKNKQQTTGPLAGRSQLIEVKLREFTDKHRAIVSTVWSTL